jgi:SAM-dependent methyltransferase
VRALRSAEARWGEEGGYYTEAPEEIVRNPLLPDIGRLRDQRILRLFDRFGGLWHGARVLEIGCGRSRWLPFLGRERGAEVFGIDIEPYAVRLAEANLAGCGVRGKVFHRDAFEVERNADLLGRFDLVYSMGVMEHFDDVELRLETLGRYLVPGGRIVTLVPNLRGVNWLLQRFADLETLETHVIYDTARLRHAHETARFRTLGCGYIGFFDGHLSSAGRSPRTARRRLHAWLCRSAGMGAEAWVRLVRGSMTPETGWFSPHVYYAGTFPPSRGL